MFFIISKLFIKLIQPFTWILIALIGYFLLRNKRAKHWCLITSITLFLIFSNPFLLNLFARYWDIDTVETNTKYSCAIILGGFVSEDQNGEGYFNHSSDRFIQALKLKTSGITNKLLFTGGNADLNPSGFREATWISNQLNAFNIPDSCILIENQSRNTLENARFSKALLEKNRLAPPYLLVTSAFHMRRSILTFKEMGVEVIPYSSNYIAGRDKLTFDDFLPRLDILSTWNFYIKEVVGFWAYKLKLKA